MLHSAIYRGDNRLNVGQNIWDGINIKMRSSLRRESFTRSDAGVVYGIVVHFCMRTKGGRTMARGRGKERRVRMNCGFWGNKWVVGGGDR